MLAIKPAMRMSELMATPDDMKWSARLEVVGSGGAGQYAQGGVTA
jgi:hypothetical protein